ncbi:MAG: hypothetical protein NZM04_06580 [Methylacidiphilales bacterium]|nr:hypothetical protein [Candidatus Methylacidiphilales bacterium]MDW8349438.1 hypothetical protein [Verrucomicrobiae bacterium]
MRLLFLTLLILLALFLTNPSFEAHKTHIIQSEEAKMKNKNTLLSAMGIGRLSGEATAALLEYHNHHIFSLTKLNGEIITIGLAHQIFRLPRRSE